jgi:hypothetical protein
MPPATPTGSVWRRCWPFRRCQRRIPGWQHDIARPPDLRVRLAYPGGRSGRRELARRLSQRRLELGVPPSIGHSASKRCDRECFPSRLIIVFAEGVGSKLVKTVFPTFHVEQKTSALTLRACSEDACSMLRAPREQPYKHCSQNAAAALPTSRAATQVILIAADFRHASMSASNLVRHDSAS